MRKNTNLFIGGNGHSGTTMIANIFKKSKQSFSSKGESRIIESIELIDKEYFKISNSEKLKFTANKLYFGHSFKKSKFQHTREKENPLILDKLDLLEPKSFIEDLNEILAQASFKLDKELFVEKTPSNVYHINQILSLINNSKVLIIQRDIRDVVASLKSRYLTIKNNPEVFAHNYEIKKLDKDYNILIDSIMWNKAINSWSNIKSKNLKIIKYENFVKDPTTVTKSICSWLDIDFHAEMLNLKSRNSSDQNLVKEEGVTASSINKYKLNLTFAEIHLIQVISGKHLKEMGYQLEKIPFIEKIKIVFLLPKDLIKIPIRAYKRFRLMNFSYFLNFSGRIIKKLMISK